MDSSLALSPFGVIHTIISLVAVIAGAINFFRDGAIVPGTTAGRVYIWMTVLTCVTGFFLFRHGGFGKPHALGVFTLLVLAVAWLANKRKFGNASIYVETVSLTFTFFLHMIPALTETFTRLPSAKPLFANPEDPALQKVVGAFFLLFVIGVVYQVRRLKANRGVRRSAALA